MPRKRNSAEKAARHERRGTCGTLPMAPSPSLDSSGPDKVGTEPHMRHTLRRLLRRVSLVLLLGSGYQPTISESSRVRISADDIRVFSGPDISRLISDIRIS